NAHERREDLAYDTQHRLAFERRAVQTFLDLGQKLLVEGLDREPIDLGPLRTLRSHGIPPVGSSGRLPYVKIGGVAYGSRWLRAPASNHRSAGPTIRPRQGSRKPW